MIAGDRTTQPHRRAGGRQETTALQAMVQGKPANLPNPQDAKRTTEKMASRWEPRPESQVLAEIHERLRVKYERPE